LKSIIRVTYINFKCHKYLVLDFSKLTCLVGASDKGKSASIKGIKWCLFNKYSGSIINFDATQATVIVEFDDGTIIKRSIGSEDNTYNITYSDGRELEMKDFGAGTIKEVAEAHGMLDSDFFRNIGNQLDKAFFLGETPTNKGALIGKLAQTDVIDLSISNTGSEIRAKNAKHKEYKKDLKETKASLADLKGLPSMEKAIEYAEKRQEKILYLENKLKNINSAVKKLGEYKSKKEQMEKVASCTDVSEEAIKLLDEAIDINEKISTIKKTLDSLNSYKKKSASAKEIIDRVSIEDISVAIEQIDEIILLTTNIKNMKDRNARLKELLKKKFELEELPKSEDIDSVIENLDKGIEILESLSRIKPVNDKYKKEILRKENGEKVIEDLDKKHDDVVEEYKNGLRESKRCEVCMSVMTEEHIHNIEEYM